MAMRQRRHIQTGMQRRVFALNASHLLLFLLVLFLLFFCVGVQKFLVQLIDVGEFEALPSFQMLFAKLVSQIFLTSVMEEGANIHFVAASAVTLNALVFFWVVETLDSRVALVALDSIFAVVPTHAILKSFAVFWSIPEEIVGSAEITCVVCVNAAF